MLAQNHAPRPPENIPYKQYSQSLSPPHSLNFQCYHPAHCAHPVLQGRTACQVRKPCRCSLFLWCPPERQRRTPAQLNSSARLQAFRPCPILPICNCRRCWTVDRDPCLQPRSLTLAPAVPAPRSHPPPRQIFPAERSPAPPAPSPAPPPASRAQSTRLLPGHVRCYCSPPPSAP